MTGFGRGEACGRTHAYTVEVQSVNHRFLEVRCRAPKRLNGLEPRLQRSVQKRFARGHFEVSVQEKDLEGRTNDAAIRSIVDAVGDEMPVQLGGGIRDLATI